MLSENKRWQKTPNHYILKLRRYLNFIRTVNQINRMVED